MGNLIAMRSQYKDAFQERHGVKLGFMSAFIKAAAMSLQEVPGVNAGELVIFVLFVPCFLLFVCLFVCLALYSVIFFTLLVCMCMYGMYFCVSLFPNLRVLQFVVLRALFAAHTPISYMGTVLLVIDDEAKEIVYRNYVDISIAVATPKG